MTLTTDCKQEKFEAKNVYWMSTMPQSILYLYIKKKATNPITSKTINTQTTVRVKLLLESEM